MTLAFFFFFPFLPCFLYQKQHVVKCLHHRHWPFLLVEKGCAVLRWPGGQECSLPGAAALMASPSAAPAGAEAEPAHPSSALEPGAEALLSRAVFSFLFPSLSPSPAFLSETSHGIYQKFPVNAVSCIFINVDTNGICV